MIHVCAKRDIRWTKLPEECMIATQYPKPDGLPYSRWAQNISPLWYHSSDHMVQAIHAGLSSPDAPQLVLIDELTASSAKMLYEVASKMRKYHPEWNGRWGIYLVNGPNVNYAKRGWFSKAIAEAMRADAVICPEFYLQASRHQTDWAIKRAMMGTLRYKRAKWLVRLRKRLKSRSRIVALMGITPKYLNEPDIEQFAVRQARIWKDNTGATIGAWKWDYGTKASPYWSVWRKR
jgi:hypothetical protein